MKLIIREKLFMPVQMGRTTQPMGIYGNTPACTDYSIVDGTKIIDGRIVLQ